MDAIEKAAVYAALLVGVREELATLGHMTQQARDEATSPESRPENQYDTRATEASYLAAGQGQRLVALQRLVGWFEARVRSEGAGDLFHLAGDLWFLLAPDGGGRRVDVAGREVVVVTAASPVGSALAQSQPGDVVRIGAHEREVLAIS